MKYLPLFSLLAYFLVSCSQNLDIPFPEHDPKLTLHAFLSPDQPIDLYVTRTYSILDEVELDEIAVKDAKVELWKNGQKIDEMVFVDTSYVDSSGVALFPNNQNPDEPNNFPILYGAKYVPSQEIEQPQAGDTYSFRVIHPAYDLAWAKTKIPFPAEVRQATLGRDELIFREAGEDNVQKWSSLDISIKDRPGFGDFYNFYIGAEIEHEEQLVDTTIVLTETRWTWIASEVLSYPNGFSFGYNKSLSDEAFDGGVYSQTWWYIFPKYFSTKPTYTRLRIKPITLTDVYANYLEKLNIQTDNRLSGIQGAFAPSESVVIPSNVVGGYGIVGAYNTAEDFIIELQ